MKREADIFEKEIPEADFTLTTVGAAAEAYRIKWAILKEIND